jgi:hypothetical protein
MNYIYKPNHVTLIENNKINDAININYDSVEAFAEIFLVAHFSALRQRGFVAGKRVDLLFSLHDHGRGWKFHRNMVQLRCISSL